MNVDSLGGVYARCRFCELGDAQVELGVQLFKGPKVGKIKDGSEVNLKSLRPLPGEDL
jgi:hypothetical protein